jgi:hypothetical protein
MAVLCYAKKHNKHKNNFREIQKKQICCLCANSGRLIVVAWVYNQCHVPLQTKFMRNRLLELSLVACGQFAMWFDAYDAFGDFSVECTTQLKQGAWPMQLRVMCHLRTSPFFCFCISGAFHFY